MNVSAAKGQPENSLLNKMEVHLEISAFLLDPTTFQKLENTGANALGMSIKQE